jgi:hypothetical protein
MVITFVIINIFVYLLISCESMLADDYIFLGHLGNALETHNLINQEEPRVP